MFNEIARILQKKATLYRFEYNNKSYCYADYYGKNPIFFKGEYYTVSVISNDDIETNNKSAFKEKLIQIELTIKDELYDLALDNRSILSYKIYEVFLDDPSSYIIRSIGTIKTKKTENEKMILEGQEPEGMLQVTTLDAVFSEQCYYNIYDDFCELNIEDWQFQTRVLVISNDSLTITLENFPADPETFRGGLFFTTTNNVETIIDLDATNKTVKIQNDFKNDLKVGDIIKIAPTCSYNYSICKNTFNNLDNFSGFIYMDGSTPFDQNKFQNKN